MRFVIVCDSLFSGCAKVLGFASKQCDVLQCWIHHLLSVIVWLQVCNIVGEANTYKPRHQVLSGNAL